MSTSLVNIKQGLDIRYFIIFIIITIIPFYLMMGIRVNQLKNLSVIDLINQNKNRRKVDKGKDTSKAESYGERGIIESIEYEQLKIKTEDMKMIKRNRKKSLKEFYIKYILRSKLTSSLVFLLTIVFIFSLLWMNYLTIKNDKIIEASYKSYDIRADIITNEPMISGGEAGLINGRHINNLMDTGLVKDYEGIASMNYDELYIERNGIIEKYEGFEEHGDFRPNFTVKAISLGSGSNLELLCQ